MSITDEDLTGVQWSLAYSLTRQHVSGVQLAILNQAASVSGVQIGLANFTDDMNGLQIGIWNQINNKEKLRVFPFVNWKF